MQIKPEWYVLYQGLLTNRFNKPTFRDNHCNKFNNNIMGRPKGRKVSPAQATKKYREKPENILKMAEDVM